MQAIPTLNKEYYYFDDGKIKPSRLGKCTILEIIPFEEIDKDILSLWEEEVEECDWVYAPTTDYFIKTTCDTDDYMYFVRCNEDRWFSLGYWASRLDNENNDLYNMMLNHYPNYKENE